MIRFTIALLFGLLALVPATQARETRQELSFQELVNFEQARAAGIDGSVRFYLAGQKANVVRRLGEGVSNRKTNSAKKTDEEACRWAALSALRAFQDSARDRGTNAVVDIVSWYKKREFRRSSNYECFAGTFVTGVTLKGTYAKVN